MPTFSEIPKIPKGVYEHYKGKRYEVLDAAMHTEAREPLVIYKALYKGDFPEGTLWARPLAMFQENVTVAGKVMPRFRYLKALCFLMGLMVFAGCNCMKLSMQGARPHYNCSF